jgi:hypothetical protein
MACTSSPAIRRTGRPTATSPRRGSGPGRLRWPLRAAGVGLVVAACASQPAAPPRNAASSGSSRITIAPDQALGWIGIAPRSKPEPGDWIPAAAQAVLVPMPAAGLAAGATLSAIDTAGRVTRVTAQAPTKVRYGCDQNQLDVLAFTGERSAPGPVWLLPPRAPAEWKPAPLAIVSPASATETRRRDTVGPLALELVRSDSARGTLAIAREGRTIYTAPIVRDAMAGAELDPIDLRQPGVAIPVPVAAWSLGEGGPILLVLQVPSYEGLHLTPILVEADRAREVPAMATYLYRCAF